MCSLHMKRWLVLAMVPVLGALTPAWVWAAKAKPRPAAQPPAAQEEFVDGIAAVVNKQVITLGQLATQVKIAQAQLRQQKIAAPDAQTLRKQVLQRMITDELLRQEADRRGIKVDDAQLQAAVNSIAQRNKIPVDRLRQEIVKSGLTWDEYLTTLRQDVLVDMLRRREVDNHILISEGDVDAYLKNEARHGTQAQSQAQAGAPVQQQAAPQVLGLAQILVAVPEGASPARQAELRKKAEDILAKLRQGANFATMAASSSDDSLALKGGDLGVKPVQGWPDVFIRATQNLKVGQISGIIPSPNGFHILKVTSRGPEQPEAAPAPAPAAPAPGSEASTAQPTGPMMVTQTHVRHILIKVDKAMSDEKAKALLLKLRQRLEMGEKFEDLAKRYSEDSSAPLGGDMGWVNPGQTVPPFEQAMNALQPGQISQPVRTQFGWHLIEVVGRRTKDMQEEYRRIQARKALFQRREEPAFEDWLSQLHGQAYIDNRLDPQSNRKRR